MTATPATPRAALPIRGADLRGLSRLSVDATLGIADIVEAMHHTIASGTFIVGSPPSGRTSGITGFVYRVVRGTTRAVGFGLDAALGALTLPAGAGGESTPRREAVLAALNGVWGDHLADTGNPLAIPMALRIDGRALALDAESIAARVPAASGRIVVLVHGLCMNDLQWQRDGHDHGQALARDLGCTPVYLHYNSGRHVAQNGREFAALLEGLVAAWPVQVDELVIVGHSMGGLLARSACFHAAQGGLAWPVALKKLVFLGTPHHGAPLERGGRLVDALFGISPYVAPFARLGKARSAGITDLRYGNLQDADLNGADRYAQHRDERRPTPLPAGVKVFLMAATTAADANPGLHNAVIGDGLVPLASALGEHRRPELALAVQKAQQQVVASCSHWDMLSRRDVYAQLRAWLE